MREAWLVASDTHASMRLQIEQERGLVVELLEKGPTCSYSQAQGVLMHFANGLLFAAV